MLHLPNMEEIHSLLLNVSSLMKLYELRDSSFVGSVKNWLAMVESILQKNRLPVTAEIAGMRGSIISSEKGEIPPGVNLSKRVTKRKITELVAEHAIQSAVETLSKAISNDLARIRNAEARIFELVILARQLELIQIEPMISYDQKILSKLWEDLKTDSGSAEKKTVTERAIAVQTMVGKVDALILLDRILSIS
ncbi:MAG: hypothetical protein A2057_00570 [Ignavibacteria bacterium GWA2_35_9]|nr:MAG: hypothetical protein A2057_00570 [Ignavibacteria bacterium GWA2_35_9]OGU48283.1 MAG: hypothetical protein A2000_02215 [Ignavibacteria bacterium GWB2_36_8]